MLTANQNSHRQQHLDPKDSHSKIKLKPLGFMPPK